MFPAVSSLSLFRMGLRGLWATGGSGPAEQDHPVLESAVVQLSAPPPGELDGRAMAYPAAAPPPPETPRMPHPVPRGSGRPPCRSRRLATHGSARIGR